MMSVEKEITQKLIKEFKVSVMIIIVKCILQINNEILLTCIKIFAYLHQRAFLCSLLILPNSQTCNISKTEKIVLRCFSLCI